MKKKLNRAICHIPDSKFDAKFWQKFNQNFSQKNELRLFLRPALVASVLVVLVVNLYSNFEHTRNREVEVMTSTTLEIDEIIGSINVEYSDDFYALYD